MSFAFPKCWDDDDRMNFLFQPFRERSANPQAYDAKSKFWKELITQVLKSDFMVANPSVLENDTGLSCPIKVNLEELSKLFCRKGVQPKCLDVAMAELERDGLLTNHKSYIADLSERISRQKASWPSWSYNVLISSPIKSFTGKLVSVVSPRSSRCEMEQFIINSNVKCNAVSLLNKVRLQAQSSMGGRYRLVLTHQDLDAEFGKFCSSEEGRLLLLWLESEKFLRKEFFDEYGDVFKFSLRDGENIEPINNIESGILQIRQSKNKLESIIAGKQSQIGKCLLDIKEQLSKKNRSQSLRLLRRKKLIERSMDKDVDHGHKLDCILDEIYHADTMQFVLQTFDKGSKALKALNDATPIDTVEDTIDELSDNMARSKDIGDTLAGPVAGSDVHTDEELEQELLELLDKKNGAEESIDDLLLALERVTVEENAPLVADKRRGKTKLVG